MIRAAALAIRAAALAAGVVAGLLSFHAPCLARTLAVGADRPYARPSEAAAAAQDGDTIRIAPGTYFDCAVWRASRLRIEADQAVTTDRACEGKAAFVIRGDDITITGMTFTRIRVPDGNGAGIRLEGHDLTVRNSRFVNNEAGIIASVEGGSLLVEDCTFAEVGPTDGAQGRAILANGINRLLVSNSVFEQARGGTHIASSARQTDLVGNTLSDNGGHIPGPLVRVDGGTIRLIGNTITLHAAETVGSGAMLVSGDAVSIEVSGNTLIAPDDRVPLVRNWTGVTATETGNVVPAGTMAVSDSGSAYHRLRRELAHVRAMAGDAARVARHQVAEAARGLGLLR